MGNSIKDLIDSFTTAANQRSIKSVFIDQNISLWLPDAIVVEDEYPKETIAVFKNKFRLTDMFSEALKMPISQGIQSMIDEMGKGYFDEKLKVLMIGLTDTGNYNCPLGLFVEHRKDGAVYLYLVKVIENEYFSFDEKNYVGLLK